MSDCPFCNLSSAAKARDGARRPGFLGRVWRSTRWVFPATVLVLIPKCPLCVAAYLALFTGIGVSVAAARGIQIVTIVACITLLAYWAAMQWLRRSRTRGLRVPGTP